MLRPDAESRPDDLAGPSHTAEADAPSSRTSAARWLRALAVAIPATYLVMLGLFFTRIGFKDHDQHLVFHEFQFWNSRLFDLAQHWTPLMCGGISLGGEPQAPLFSAGMLLGYVLGPLYGLRTAILLYLALGWAGAYLYAGYLTRERLLRCLAASLYIGNGFFVARICHGHIPMLPFLILPLALWAMHRTTGRSPGRHRPLGVFGLLFFVAVAGACLAIMVDGSPQTIIYFLPWVFVYAAVLSLTARSAGPLVFALGAGLAALPLGAGYLLPMINAQQAFSRITPDSFTNPIVLPWFMLLPARGKIIPAPGHGHEYTVFIGPILAWLIWKLRKRLFASLPRAVATPLLVTALFSFVMGMGSLALIGVPEWLSLFDILRPLPGFRSVGITGRYWGFLALPLAMLGATALYRWALETPNRRKRVGVLTAVAVLQIGVQVEGIAKHLVSSESYEAIGYRDSFDGEPETIEFVKKQHEQLQGRLITPTRGVVNCYNHRDFRRPPMLPGRRLVVSVKRVGGEPIPGRPVRGRFVTWSDIVLHAAAGKLTGQLEVTLNQAYARQWSASAGDAYETPSENLALRLPAEALRDGGVHLTFRNPESLRGLGIASSAWKAWFVGTLVLGVAYGIKRFWGSTAPVEQPTTLA